MRLGKVMLLALLFLNLAYAAPVDFTPLIPITAITVVIFLSGMRMLASAINSPQISAWVKTELRELLAGVILVAIIFALFIGSKGITSALSGTGDYLDTSIDIIDNIMTNQSVGYDRAMHDIIRAGTRIRAAATYSPYLSVPLWYVGVTYSTSPMSGVGVLFSSLSQATQGVANAIFLYEGIALLLRFSAAAIPTVLLPLSLCFRMIPFTRKIGNTLIAVSLGALVLLPFSVILIGAVHGAIDYPEAHLTGSQLNKLDPGTWAMTVAEPFCQLMPIRLLMALNDLNFSLVVCLPLLLTPWTAPFYPQCVSIVQNFVYPILMVFLQIAYDAALLGWLSFAGEGIGYANEAFDIIYPFLAQVNNVVLLGYVDAMIIGLITITGTKSISVALGGEWYMGGIQRLI